MIMLSCVTPSGNKVRVPYRPNETIGDLKKRIAAQDGSDWQQISVKALVSKHRDIVFTHRMVRVTNDSPLDQVFAFPKDAMSNRRERYHQRVCSRIEAICGELSAERLIVDLAKSAFKKASACSPYRTANDRVVAAVHVYAACQMARKPHDITLISLIAKARKNTVAYYYREYEKLRDRAYASWGEQKASKVSTAASVYMMTDTQGRARTAGEIAREAGVSEAAIAEAYEKAREHINAVGHTVPVVTKDA